MMQLVIKNGHVLARHETHQDIDDAYPDAEIVNWDGPRSALVRNAEGHIPDPRTEQEKQTDEEQKFQRERRRRYPRYWQLLRLIYRDMKHGTTEFVDTIDAIHDRFKSSS